MAGPEPCNGGGMTAGPGGAPTCSCQGGCSGGNGGGNQEPCQAGNAPPVVPTGTKVHHVRIIVGVPGTAIYGPNIKCVETEVTYASGCPDVPFTWETAGTYTYVTAGGRASHCLPDLHDGTAGSGQATGTTDGQTVIISVPWSPDP
jgi:hypothetical protein